MAPDARSAGSPKVPAGQPANDQVTAEVNIGPGGATSAGQSQGSNTTLLGSALPDDQRPDEDEPSDEGIYIQDEPSDEGIYIQDEPDDEGTYYEDDRSTRPSQAWREAAPQVRADGWDADNTAAWNPASAWAEEDAEGGGAGGELWDEEPDWEGEIVVWEAQRLEVVPAPLPPTGWSGAPTSPPTYAPDHLPAHLRTDDAVVPFAGPGAVPAPPGVYDRKASPLTRRENGPWRELVIITAVAVIVSALILAVTTAEKNNVAGLGHLFGSPGTTAVPPASTANVAAGATSSNLAAHSPTSPSPGAVSPTTSKSTASTLSQRASSLPVTAAVAQSLVNSWLATNPGGYGISPADVAGTVPNQVYYAVQPATGTYWALAAFKPSAALMAESSTQTGQAELAEFHDSVYAFSWQAGPVWTLVGEFSTGSCPDVWVPRTVLTAWRLCGL